MNHSNGAQPQSRQKKPHILPQLPLDEALTGGSKSATQETLERLEYGVEGYPGDIGEVDSNGERVNEEGVSVNEEDRVYRAELEMDGYDSIEDYDNGSLNLNVDQKPDTAQALNFSDREELPNGEESSTDPQENHNSP